MKTFYFKTGIAHTDNNETMQVYLEEHLPSGFDVIFEDGTYTEIQNKHSKQIFAVHAGGDGDFFSHKIEFELIK